MKKYVVRLEAEERAALEQILLRNEVFALGRESLRKRLVEEGLESALQRKPQVRPSVERMFDGEKEAKLIAIACSSKPEGRTRWTLELLAERVVALKIVEKCSPKTIGRVLQKTS